MPQRQAPTRIDLLRHGSCEGGEIYRGSTDVALDARGWEQMRRAVEPGMDWQRIVTSPLRRCHDFAREQAQVLDIPLRVEKDLREMHFGDWEGQSVEEVWATQPEICRAFYADPGAVTPPGAEPMPEVKARALAVWQRLLVEHRGERILLVAHGGVIRTLLCELLSMPLSAVARIDVSYATLCSVVVHHSTGGDFPIVQALAPGDQSQ